MRKRLLSILIPAIMVSSPVISFAAANYDINTPSIQYTPMQQNQGYQTQYPLPVNSYQNQGYGYNNYNTYNNNQFNQLQGNVVMVPASTTFAAVSMTPLSSETSKLGDMVTFYLSNDFYYGQNLIASAGSRINGTVIKVRKGGFANRNGQLQIKFNSLITPTGQTIPISASIQTDDGSGILKAGTAKDATKEYVKDVGIGAAAGAALGTAMGALSSGSVGKGAIYGTALGGGLGLGKSLIEKGGNVEIPQNAQLNIVLDQPVTVSSNSPY